MMKEIGGYIELDTYHLPMLHDGAVALNCGRNALAYLFQSRKIRKILLPYFLCSSVSGVCDREGVKYRYYHIRENFLPEEPLAPDDDEWLYLVNYYGQMDNDRIGTYVSRYRRVIVDQAHSYFQEPLPGVDTIYACRKYFGVADGAFLYTEARLDRPPEQDESFDRMRFLLGRYERSASEFYREYVENNELFEHEPVRRMSKLTENLLHGIDYKEVRNVREANFLHLHRLLGDVNLLDLQQFPGTYMYPFRTADGEAKRKVLIEKKIYIPLLWPDIPRETEEYQLALSILPLPIDQRYGAAEMEYLAGTVLG